MDVKSFLQLADCLSSKREYLSRLGVCWSCCMRHSPACDEALNLCRNCNCGKEWHPLDGPCRVGPETEFTLGNCFCQCYIPKDNLEYLEWLVNKSV